MTEATPAGTTAEPVTHTATPAEATSDGSDDDDDLPPGLSGAQVVQPDDNVAELVDEQPSAPDNIDELDEGTSEAADDADDANTTSDLIDSIIAHRGNPWLILQLAEPELTVLHSIHYLPPSATTLQKQYRTLTIQLHPDRYSRFNDKQLVERAELAYTLAGNAYETLRDEKKLQQALDEWKLQHAVAQQQQSSGWDPKQVQQEIQQLSKQRQLTDHNSTEHQRRKEVQQYTTTLKDKMRQRLQSQQQRHKLEVEAEQKIVELKQRLMQYKSDQKGSGGKQQKRADGSKAAATPPNSNDSGDYERLAAARHDQSKRQKKR